MDSTLLLEYITSQHHNIKFTIEKELDGKLSFLDSANNAFTVKLKEAIHIEVR